MGSMKVIEGQFRVLSDDSPPPPVSWGTRVLRALRYVLAVVILGGAMQIIRAIASAGA